MKKLRMAVACIAVFVMSMNVFAVDMEKFKLQEPKGDSMDLVSFTPTLINFPFEIKYPEKWYVREDATAFPSLFLTQEPIRSETDKYTVGAAFLYNINYFVSKEPANSTLGKTAELVLKVRDWSQSERQFIDDIVAGGNKIISHSELTISGQPALKVEYESSRTHVTTVYIKVGVHLLVIIFEAPPQEYSQYKDTFDKMLNSFFITR